MARAHARSTRSTAERLGAPVPGSRRADRPCGVGWWQPRRRPTRLSPFLVRLLSRLRLPSVAWPARRADPSARRAGPVRAPHRHRRIRGMLPGPLALVLLLATAVTTALLDGYPHPHDRVTVVAWTVGELCAAPSGPSR